MGNNLRIISNLGRSNRFSCLLKPNKSETTTESSSGSCRSVKSLHLHQLMTREIKERDVYDDYEKIQDISEGSMGSVSLVQKKRQGRNRKSNDCFLFEGFFSRLIRDKNYRETCRYYAEYHNRIAIVMELCSGGDLFSRDPYTEDRARHIVRQITSAVAYMHRCGIIHRGEQFAQHTSPCILLWIMVHAHDVFFIIII